MTDGYEQMGEAQENNDIILVILISSNYDGSLAVVNFFNHPW